MAGARQATQLGLCQATTRQWVNSFLSLLVKGHDPGWMGRISRPNGVPVLRPVPGPTLCRSWTGCRGPGHRRGSHRGRGHRVPDSPPAHRPCCDPPFGSLPADGAEMYDVTSTRDLYRLLGGGRDGPFRFHCGRTSTWEGSGEFTANGVGRWEGPTRDAGTRAHVGTSWQPTWDRARRLSGGRSSMPPREGCGERSGDRSSRRPSSWRVRHAGGHGSSPSHPSTWTRSHIHPGSLLGPAAGCHDPRGSPRIATDSCLAG